VRNVKWVTGIKLSDVEATGPWQRGMSYKGFGPSVRTLEGLDVEGIPSLQEQAVQSSITFPAAASIATTTTAAQRVNNSPSPSVLTAALPVPAGEVLTVKGYAYAGGGRGILRVDVSIDGGRTWRDAQLTEGSCLGDARAAVRPPCTTTSSSTSSTSSSTSSTGNSGTNDSSISSSSGGEEGWATEQRMDRAWAWTFWECDVEVPGSLAGQQLEVVCKATDVGYNVQPDSVDGVWNLRGINNNAWQRMRVNVVAPAEEDEE
jgi:sulfite oxidase